MDVKKLYEDKKISAPVHLSKNNEEQLIEIFKRISTNDYVFSTWRSHYHALLKDICPVWIEEEILKGKSIIQSLKDSGFKELTGFEGDIPKQRVFDNIISKDLTQKIDLEKNSITSHKSRKLIAEKK